MSGQCLYTLLVGPIGEPDEFSVSDSEARQFSAIAKVESRKPLSVPTWALDGMHCEGSDPRFAGSLPHMAAACNAFQHYGRLSPQDTWLDEFYEHTCN